MTIVGVIAVTFVVVLVASYLVLRVVLRSHDRVFCKVCGLQYPRHKAEVHVDKGLVCKKCAFALAAGARNRYWGL